nr:DUF2946 family protein [Sphingomonas bacterium]
MAASPFYGSDVLLVRRLLRTNRRFAVLFLALALAMKLLTPTGYMFVEDGGRIAVTLCPGFAPVAPPPEMSGMSAMSHKGDHGSSKGHGKPELPCAFAGLTASALGAVDAILLAAALAFVAALALRPVRPRPVFHAPHLRPPLRGPPIPF